VAGAGRSAGPRTLEGFAGTGSDRVSGYFPQAPKEIGFWWEFR
jgi:hypothetical protein